MKNCKTVDEFISNAEYGKVILEKLREIVASTELVETIKWGTPVYTLQGKNVVGIGSFKSYSGLWFFQGALLNDKQNVLINAQKDKTKALRQWRFTSIEEVDQQLVLEYVEEAIQNQKENKEIKPKRKKKLDLPAELENAFKKNEMLSEQFKKFTPGKQREFAEYISNAKQQKTRDSRLQKIIPLIQKNKGLNDKYRTK